MFLCTVRPLYINAPCVSICEHMLAFVSLACIGIHLCVHACILFLCAMSVHARMCTWTVSHCCAVHHPVRNPVTTELGYGGVHVHSSVGLTGVSERAAVLSAQSAYTKELSDTKCDSSHSPEACSWLSSLEPPTPPSGQLNSKPVSCGSRRAWASTVFL